MQFLGCDPDLSTAPIASVDEDLKLLWVVVVKAVPDLPPIIGMVQALHHASVPYNVSLPVMAYAVEAQEIYPDSRVPAQDILHLGQMAGAAMLRLREINSMAVAYFPKPVQWKGTREKLPHHHQILLKAGCPVELLGRAGGKNPYGYPQEGAFPYLPIQYPMSQWKHICDAVGLAQFAAVTYLAAERKARYLATPWTTATPAS